jgi:hypothetical protein
MRKSILTLVFMCASAAPANAQVILFFDAFLFDNAGQPADNYNDFFQWNVNNGTVDLMGGNVPGSNDPSLGRFVDLSGSTNDAGEFATRLPLTFLANTTYNLSFEYRNVGETANMVMASIGKHAFIFSSDTSELQTFSQDFSFPTQTVAHLVFQNSGNDSTGMGIDTITVIQPVPEPTTMTLLLGAAGVIGAFRCRRGSRKTCTVTN